MMPVYPPGRRKSSLTTLLSPLPGLNQAGTSSDQDFYRAARIYNSGSIHYTTRLECGIATHCYASDIANRLTGWVYAGHGCACDTNPSSCGCPA